MQAAMIRWKLNEVMAKSRVRNKDLAQALGITDTSVSRLRKRDDMPQLKPKRLNDLCSFLKCQPGELMEYVEEGSE